jgi:cupin superfamily acireductone dioxygenase involved in methionine salvage
MQEGDLVHIPQGVELWCETERGMRLRMTEKPMAGVYLSTRSQYIYRVYANGDWNVKRRDVYPMENNNAVS